MGLRLQAQKHLCVSCQVNDDGDGPGHNPSPQKPSKTIVRLDSQVETRNVEVKATRIVSPGEIYIQLVTAEEDGLTK